MSDSVAADHDAWAARHALPFGPGHPEWCPAADEKDPGHCEHWFDCEPCHRCGDDTRDPNCDCERCDAHWTLRRAIGALPAADQAALKQLLTTTFVDEFHSRELIVGGFKAFGFTDEMIEWALS